MSGQEELPEMETTDVSDLQLIYSVRDTLVEVTLVNHFRNCPATYFVQFDNMKPPSKK